MSTGGRAAEAAGPNPGALRPSTIALWQTPAAHVVLGADVHAVATAILGDTAVAWPRAGHLSLKVARALVLGVEAREAAVSVRLDANGLDIDPLVVADFGGASLAVRGRIDWDDSRAGRVPHLSRRRARQ